MLKNINETLKKRKKEVLNKAVYKENNVKFMKKYKKLSL